MRNDRAWKRAQDHYRAGRLDMARAACEAILRSADADAGAHWMLSCIAQSEGGFREAVVHAQRAAAEGSRLPPYPRLAASRQLISVGEYGHACRLLASFEPETTRDATLLREIVEQLSMLDRHAHAAEWLDAASRHALATSDIAFLRGNNRKFHGDFDAANEAYEQAIRLFPANVHAHLAMAGLARREGSARRIDRLRRLAAGDGAGATAGDRAALHYALFKELDAEGDTVEAWAALERGLQCKRETIDHDPRSEDALFDRLIEANGPGSTAQAQSAGADPVSAPIFIVGMPRTGTTLVERVLGSHPDVSACGELGDLRMRYKWASDHYCPGFLDHEAVSRMPRVDTGALGRDYLAHVAWRSGGKSRFTDKNPGNHLFCGLILRSLPKARIVCLQRDAMDACFANLRELFAHGYYEYSYATADVARHYRNFSRWIEHIAPAATDRMLVVKYEDFVASPDRETARIVDFCGLPPLEGLARQDMRPGQAVSTASSVQVRAPIDAGRVGKWRRYERQLAPLRDALAAVGHG